MGRRPALRRPGPAGITCRPRLQALLLALALVSPPAAAQEQGGQAAQGDAAPETPVQQFEDWALECGTPEGGDGETCYMFQNIVVKDTGQRLLHTAVGYAGDGSTPMLLLTAPLGVHLPGGLRLQIDDGETMRMPFERCTSRGCHAAATLEQDVVDALKAGLQLKVTFGDGASEPVTLPVSLQGFTRAYQAIR